MATGEEKPRIAFVFIDVFAKEGGIQSYVRDLINAYVNEETNPAADIYILQDQLSDPNPFTNNAKLEFFLFGNRLPLVSRLLLAAVLFRNLRSRAYTRVVCGHVQLAQLVGPLCQLNGIPYSVMTYGKDVWGELPWLQRRSLIRSESIWTISRYTRDLACAENGLDSGKFRMLSCVVDGSAFTPGEEKEELIQRYGLQGSRVVMTVTRLWPGDIYKGVDVTIRALPRIAQEFPDIKYLVIGRGDDQSRLARLARDLGVDDKVVFAGFVPTEELVDHYRLADGFVMPSREGYGIVYLEAMACGVPVISGDDDGSAEPLQDGRLGWRVPHRDPDAVAEACIDLLRGEDRRCDGEWLREETLRHNSLENLRGTLRRLIEATNNAPLDQKDASVSRKHIN